MLLLSRDAKKWKALAKRLYRSNKTLSEMVGSMLKEPAYVRKALIVRDMVRVDVDHPAISWLVQACGDFFENARVMNYVMLDFTHPKVGSMTVTVQKNSGKTPTRVNNELQDEVARLKSALRDIGNVARERGENAIEAAAKAALGGF